MLKFLLCQGGYDWGDWEPMDDPPDDINAVAGIYYEREQREIREHIDILYKHVYSDQYDRQEQHRLDLEYENWQAVGTEHSQAEADTTEQNIVRTLLYSRLIQREGWFVELDSWEEAVVFASKHDMALIATSYLQEDKTSLFALVR